jgi:RNA polymerase sigma factor (TIGR02999 family)
MMLGLMEPTPPPTSPRYGNGDKEALSDLIPQIYDELRRLASCYLQGERVDHTLQTTALVHEAYFRLVDQKQVESTNRNHFFGVAAQMMRRILVDHARKHHAFKRGSSRTRVSLDQAEGLFREQPQQLMPLTTYSPGWHLSIQKQAELSTCGSLRDSLWKRRQK